jgi:hypothetical protein
MNKYVVLVGPNLEGRASILRQLTGKKYETIKGGNRTDAISGVSELTVYESFDHRTDQSLPFLPILAFLYCAPLSGSQHDEGMISQLNTNKKPIIECWYDKAEDNIQFIMRTFMQQSGYLEVHTSLNELLKAVSQDLLRHDASKQLSSSAYPGSINGGNVEKTPLLSRSFQVKEPQGASWCCQCLVCCVWPCLPKLQG